MSDVQPGGIFSISFAVSDPGGLDAVYLSQKLFISGGGSVNCSGGGARTYLVAPGMGTHGTTNVSGELNCTLWEGAPAGTYEWQLVTNDMFGNFKNHYGPVTVQSLP